LKNKLDDMSDNSSMTYTDGTAMDNWFTSAQPIGRRSDPRIPGL